MNLAGRRFSGASAILCWPARALARSPSHVAIDRIVRVVALHTARSRSRYCGRTRVRQGTKQVLRCSAEPPASVALSSAAFSGAPRICRAARLVSRARSYARPSLFWRPSLCVCSLPPSRLLLSHCADERRGTRIIFTLFARK